MMKRNRAVLAFIVAWIWCFSGMDVNAAYDQEQESSHAVDSEMRAGYAVQEEYIEPQKENEIREDHTELQKENAGQKEGEETQAEDAGQKESEEPQTEDVNQKKGMEPQREAAGQGEGMEPQAENATREDVPESGLCSLQIPQKMEVVIDPWEIDGKGQIYSEQYTIQNMGDETGVLTLSFQCRKGEGSTAILRTDKAGLHDDENKSIYIEMIFGGTEGKVLGEEGLEYQAELEPGEALGVSFAGEVNENASESWGNGDVEIEGIYFWKVAEDADTDTETEADVDGTEDLLDSETDDADGIGGEPAAGGNDPLENAGADSAEGTDSSVAEEPAEGNDGQNEEGKDNESESQDAAGTENSEASDGDSAGDAQSGTETVDPVGGEESSSSSGQDDGEMTPEESGEVPASEDGDDSLSMESVQDKTELGTEDTTELLPGVTKENQQPETDDEDIPGTDSRETGQNPEMGDADDGREG